MALCSVFRILKCYYVAEVFSIPRAFIKVRNEIHDKGDIFLKKPKRPLNPYAKFLSEHKFEIQESISTADATNTLFKKASRLWTKVPESDKQKLWMTYKSEMKNYKNEMEQWKLDLLKAEIEERKSGLISKKRLLPVSQKEEAKLLGKPKRPGSPAVFFVKEQLEKLNESDPKLLQNIIKKWTQIPDAEKQLYKEKYKAAQEKFVEDLLNWEKEMVQLGFKHLVRQKTLKSHYNNL